MFDTMKVAHKIREARISQNMTQMNLADAMAVSYQAVSNWERGNSMPDIAKLEQLCNILHISMEELLGSESTSKTLNRLIKADEPAEDWDEPVTMEDIQEFAPILPPSDVERLVDDHLEQQDDQALDLSAIIGLAPFLDSSYLDSLAERAHADSLAELAGLAPFLSQHALDSLVKNSDPEADMSGIISLAPFLSRETLDWLVSKVPSANGLQGLIGLAPFLSEDNLDRLVKNANPEADMSGIVGLAPFLSRETLDWLAHKLPPANGLNSLVALAPFLSSDTLDHLVKNANPESDMSGIMGLAPFLSQETLQEVAERLLRGKNPDAAQSLAPFCHISPQPIKLVSSPDSPAEEILQNCGNPHRP